MCLIFQAMRVSTPPRAISETPANAAAVAEETKSVSRPRPTELMYQRQASYRGLGQISGHTPFKRQTRGQLSLRLNELPSTRERLGAGGLLTDTPILEDIELPPSNLEGNSHKSLDLLSEDPFSPSEMVSGSSTPALPGGSVRSFVGGDSSSTYSMSPPPSTTANLLIPVKLHKLPETPESEQSNPWDNVPDQPGSVPSRPAASPVPPRLPATQPPKTGLDSLDILAGFRQHRQPSSLPLNSSSSAADKHAPFSSLPLNELLSTTTDNHSRRNNTWTTIEQAAETLKAPFIKTSDSGLELGKTDAGSSSGYNSPTSTNSSVGVSQASDLWRSNLLENEPVSLLEHSIQTSILEDPFDAEWAAIATRNYADRSNNNNHSNSNTTVNNPIISNSSSSNINNNPFTPDSSVQSFENSLKSFELQL